MEVEHVGGDRELASVEEGREVVLEGSGRPTSEDTVEEHRHRCCWLGRRRLGMRLLLRRAHARARTRDAVEADGRRRAPRAHTACIHVIAHQLEETIKPLLSGGVEVREGAMRPVAGVDVTKLFARVDPREVTDTLLGQCADSHGLQPMRHLAEPVTDLADGLALRPVENEAVPATFQGVHLEQCIIRPPKDVTAKVEEVPQLGDEPGRIGQRERRVSESEARRACRHLGVLARLAL